MYALRKEQWPNIGYTRCLRGQSRVPFFVSVGHGPRTPSDWPTPASTQPWPHFRRIDPFLAIQHAKRYQIINPLPDDGRAVRPHRPNGPHHAPSEFHRISSLLRAKTHKNHHLPDVQDFVLPPNLLLFSFHQKPTSTSSTATAISLLRIKSRLTAAQHHQYENDERLELPP